MALANAANASPLLLAEATAIDAFIQIDPDSGAGTESPDLHVPPQGIAGLAYDPDRNILYASTFGVSVLASIDLSTGDVTEIGAIGAQRLVQGLEFDPIHRVLYGSDINSGSLLIIDTLTGAGTEVGPIGFDSVHGLAYDPVGGVLYGTNSSPAMTTLLAIDVSTGQGTPIGILSGATQVESLAFDASTGLLYGTERSGVERLYAIDPITASATVRGPIGFDGVFGLAVVPVPEPATFTLVASALLALAWRSKRS